MCILRLEDISSFERSKTRQFCCGLICVRPGALRPWQAEPAVSVCCEYCRRHLAKHFDELYHCLQNYTTILLNSSTSFV